MSRDLARPYEGAFVGATHHFACRVYFEDTDAGGVVYHANHLRFMERARSDMLRAAGIDQRAALDGGAGVYVVADVHIRYLRPARLDDALLILSEVRSVGAASCVIHQGVRRGDEILADATVTAVLVGPDGRPRRQPRAWIDIFERLRGKGE